MPAEVPARESPCVPWLMRTSELERKHPYHTRCHSTVLSQLLCCFATLAAATCDRLRRSDAAFASPHHTSCVRMRLTARAYSHSRDAAHRSMLIHVCVDHAYSFLCMLRMPQNCLRVDGLIQYSSVGLDTAL